MEGACLANRGGAIDWFACLRFFVVVSALLLASWFVFGRSALEEFVRNRSKPWAVFQVPENPEPLTGLEAKLAANVVTVCNRSDNEWSNVLVQIDQGYLAGFDHLQAGECKQIAIRDFTTESWKRMPPPSGLWVTRVAVLATVARKGYGQKSLLDRSALASH